MKLAHRSDEDILAIANPIMDNLMAGSTEINHSKHTRDFTDRLKAIVSEAYLQKVCQRYQAEWGYFADREFVAIFRRPESVAIVWKQYCSKQAGEFVAELVLLEQNGRYLVDHAMVY
ncbi:hypothetical protein A1359_04590 [Methylomonas lenta]|uniref:DUF4440 domain-containing protein n=1 Tax=Methylomonas lenta TaxID=980561 RepID=A0A177NNN0_9GAMM|nr:hypothetical protein [Methylomonas lenta]OAI18640.1 hypothetical protein A1359_04590 [Methylomonas lenta]